MDIFQAMTPFLLASIGGLYTEYSGTTNVAIEGYMTMSAFLFITIYKITGSYFLGITLALILIILLSFIHSYLTVKLKANSIITGLAVNMGFFGLISTIEFKLFNTKGVIFLERTTRLDSSWLIVVALILPLLTMFIINKTRYGLRLRIRGISKKTLMYSNINPDFYRISAVIVSGILAGLGGIFLAMELRSFIPNISAGRGWISLVIIYLGRKHPIGIFFGCLIFSITQIFSNFSQKMAIPSDIILAFPYILTLVALILTSRTKVKKDSL